MNKLRFIKGTVLPFAVIMSVLLFVPSTGMLSAHAAVQNVQQTETITGTVVDQAGETVIGASVLVVGAQTTTGTVTDFDGNFMLKVKPGTQLKITFVGYKDKIVKAANGMKVVLEENSTMLQGVEIVAYGVQKKVTVTGAISSVKSEDLTRTSVGSAANVLGGQLSGVTTVQYSGEPGSDAADIFVRGKGTWGDSSPLIQVDGVERSMNDVDPNEIESITVLKDASATAVFGVRGANGVVLITTKRGAEGKAKISFSTSFTALTPTKMVDMASSLDYALFYNKMRANDGMTPMFSDAVIQKFRDGSDPIRFPNTNWVNYTMKDVTLQTQHNMNISGGTDKVRYFISAGMYTQGGLFKEFDMPYNCGYQYNRFNYRANLDLKATKTTTISFNVAGNVNNSDKTPNSQNVQGFIKDIYSSVPFSSPGFIDNKLVLTASDYEDVQLPFKDMGHGLGYYRKGFNQINNNKLQMDLMLDQKLDFITKGLSLKLKGSYNSSFTVTKTGTAGVATYTPVLQPDGTIKYRKSGENTDPSYSASQGKARDWYFEGSFNYNRSFGEHTVTALALYNQSKQYYYSSSSYSDVPRGYVGFVGRVTYDYKNRYMAEFNIGYNGSENFAPGKRFGTFPAGSVGWVISDESFFKPLRKVVSFLKLRASWGLVGNDKTTTGTRFMYLADPYYISSDGLASNAYSNADNHYGYAFGDGGVQADVTATKGAYEKSKNNPEVGWEKAFKQDYGFDMNFLDDRLRTTFDYYTEHRTNILLLDATVPTIIGFTVPYANLGEVKSHGWELSLNWNDKIGDNFRYWAKLNLSYNFNEVVEMKEAPQKNEYQYQRGHRIGARSQYKFWKYYYEGAEADYQKEFGKPFPTQLVANLKPGDCVFVDLDGDGKIDESDMSRDYGFTDDPQYMAGLTLGFAWKRLTFNAQLTGAWNVSRSISAVFRQPFFRAADTVYGGLLQYHVNDTWSVDNPSQNAEYPRATWENAANNYAGSDLYEKDSKYLRLKTLSIAYDFNNSAFKSIGLTKFEVTLSGYNLLTLTPYKWGDPEATASSSPSYPLQRTYTIGLNVGF